MADDTMLVSDIEREHALAQLREATVDGRLTLGEFTERTELVLIARTRTELVPLTTGLVEPDGRPAVPPRPPRQFRRWALAILGSSKQRGRWRASEQTRALALMGECKIDLRHAEIEGNELELDAYAVMGEVKILVPRGVDVEMNGLAILGAKEFDGDDRPLPGAPRINVHAFALMGSVKVEISDEPAAERASFRIPVRPHIPGPPAPPMPPAPPPLS